MPIVRQMPRLIIRGAVANITMPNLDAQQQAQVNEITKQVASHPEMAKHRLKMIEKLGATIGADYADDRLIAEQEYLVAIWRGVVELMYHHKYTFKCNACGSANYRTGRGSAKPIDHIQTPCPNCKQVQVTAAGATDLIVGEYVTHEHFQESYEHLSDSDSQPECTSTIVPIKGDKKYADPDKILKNDVELKKFFGEFAWNYFRQQIIENKRTTHGAKPKEFIDRVDIVTAHEIAALCLKMRVGHSFDHKILTDGRYTIMVSGMQTPPEFSEELMIITQRAEAYGASVELTNQAIFVRVNSGLPLIPTQIVMPERAKVLDNNACIAGEEQLSVVGQLDYRSVGGARMDQDDHVDYVDTTEAMQTVRNRLPVGDCRRIYDILCQDGEEYLRYRDRYGDGIAKINHLAQFLNINAKTVKSHQSTIRTTMIATDLVPA